MSRRYEHKPTIVTTNKVFKDWNTVFPNAGSVVALVDRLTHRAEIVEIDGESYRLKEAEERKARLAAERRSRRSPRTAQKTGQKDR